MLSFLNALVGFAAFFAILSLMVTTIVQLVRTFGGSGSRRLVDTLLHLFGEIDQPERLVAALLVHPSLTGAGRKDVYDALVNPTSSTPPAGAKLPPGTRTIDDLVHWVLDAHRSTRKRWSWWRYFGSSPTADLDKQTVKDIASTVYARIGSLVDPFPPTNDPLDAQILTRWGTSLKNNLQSPPPAPVSAPPSPAMAASPVTPHLGRLWLLATAAFPEGDGRASPIKTYVAAFHDEACASASDAFTLRIRAWTAVIALVFTIGLQLDAVVLWNQLAGASPAAIDAAARAAQQAPGAPNATAATPKMPTGFVQQLGDQAAVLKNLPVQVSFKSPREWRWPGVGFFLAWIALSLGAPFWFEILKSGIDMKSAFTKDDGSKK